MSEAIVFLWPAFLVSICLVGIHAYFGIQVLARKVIDLALAQIAALGATVAFMLGHPTQSPATYVYSLAFTLLASVLLAFTRAWATRVPQEALIGVIYVVAAAVSILLIDRAPQGAEHLKQILTGNILFARIGELYAIVPLYAAVGLLHSLLRRRLTGSRSLGWEFLFFATFGLIVTSSVAIAGVLLVFSFLIVPAAIGVIFGRSLAIQLAIGWTVGTLTSAVGLAASFAFDLPTGAAMVCAFGGALALSGALYAFLQGSRGTALRMMIIAARWSAAAILVGSALPLAFAPRADQPVLDVAEHVFHPCAQSI
jgi:zinc/manganese transport system permease protein